MNSNSGQRHSIFRRNACSEHETSPHPSWTLRMANIAISRLVLYNRRGIALDLTSILLVFQYVRKRRVALRRSCLSSSRSGRTNRIIRGSGSEKGCCSCRLSHPAQCSPCKDRSEVGIVLSLPCLYLPLTYGNNVGLSFGTLALPLPPSLGRTDAFSSIAEPAKI